MTTAVQIRLLRLQRTADLSAVAMEHWEAVHRSLRYLNGLGFMTSLGVQQRYRRVEQSVGMIEYANI